MQTNKNKQARAFKFLFRYYNLNKLNYLKNKRECDYCLILLFNSNSKTQYFKQTYQHLLSFNPIIPKLKLKTARREFIMDLLIRK